MNIKPILFSTDAVKAILAKEKTATRRVVKPQPPKWIDKYERSQSPIHWLPSGIFLSDPAGILTNGNAIEVRMNESPVKCPYGKPGDTLLVKESLSCSDGGMFYTADGKSVTVPESYERTSIREKIPGLLMSHWAARIFLRIKGIRIEQLHKISWRDAAAEGVDAWGKGECPGCSEYGGCPTPRSLPDGNGDEVGCGTFVHGYISEFTKRWDVINGKKYPWSSNPWVWVIEFEKVEKEAP